MTSRTYLLLPSMLFSAYPPSADAASAEREAEVRAKFKQMEAEVLAFKDEVEEAYARRCDESTLAECSRNNFDDCSSAYPNQECMRGDELVIDSCGDGLGCNALWDKTTTAVRIPQTLASDDPSAIESVCYGRLAEEYMVEKYGSGTGQMYFGSAAGTFRIVPARHSEVCGEYDHRRRPWFVAASSGPKDVVLVIDVSGSMDDYCRIELAREAAKTIVDTLTVADRFAVVAFSGAASMVGLIGDDKEVLVRATAENKERMMDAIDKLQAGGGTNFYDAFETAFDAIDNTIEEEQTSGCNVAVLFMTDGQISGGPGIKDGTANDKVTDLVNERTQRLASLSTPRKTTVFTFSLGFQADHEVTKSIACNTGGIWTPVDDLTGDLVSAMSAYYKLYALGLGEGGNEDFTAWVEPYPFHTAGKVGTSVSAPVYDWSVYPPLFLGVVAVDSYMDEIEEMLGEDASSSKMLDRFVLMSTARCPKIELTERELDALRYLAGGKGATCGVSNATDAYAGIVPETCPTQSDLPNLLWHNTDMKGKDYKSRACCEIGGAVPSDMCPATPGTIDPFSDTTSPEPAEIPPEETTASSNVGIIIGIVAAIVAVMALLAFVRKRKRSAQNQAGGFGETQAAVAVPVAAADNAGPDANNRVAADIELIRQFSSSIKQGVSAVPPPETAPTAPPAHNPAFVPAG